MSIHMLEGGREGGREEEGEREGGREGGREGWMDGWREGGRKGGRKGGKEGEGTSVCCYVHLYCLSTQLTLPRMFVTVPTWIPANHSLFS